jgi:hypothetical protein
MRHYVLWTRHTDYVTLRFGIGVMFALGFDATEAGETSIALGPFFLLRLRK